MAFYQDIASAYDEIFPLNKQQVRFIEGICPIVAGQSVLDAGCGTGNLAIELGRRGAAVKAFDLDETMLHHAIKKCPQALNVQFKHDDLLKIGQNYPAGSFDMAYCFGNTLVHLHDEEAIIKFMEGARKVLREKGHLLLQIVNYDRVLTDQVKSLPTIESDHYIFERNYDYTASGKINFSTHLISKEDQTVNKQSVDLIPLTKERLSEMLNNMFSSIRFYGSFNREDWNMKSFHTVVEASV